MQINNNTAFLECNTPYQASEIVILGAPFDGTTSFRPGTRFAPNAIRLDSIGIETYSPYQNKDLTELAVCDIGDISLPFGNTMKVLEEIERYAAKIYKDRKLPFVIGGEHLISLPVIKAASRFYNNLHIIHLDAHTDLRSSYLGETLSHATVIKRAWEIVGDNKIFQFGIRSGEKQEFEWAEKHTFMQKYNCNKLDEVVKKINPHPVYITVDLDILDPSVFPGTGTPEPGGIDFNELTNAIKVISNLDNIVGVDVVELSPHYDISGISTAAACKTIRELLLAIK